MRILLFLAVIILTPSLLAQSKRQQIENLQQQLGILQEQSDQQAHHIDKLRALSQESTEAREKQKGELLMLKYDVKRLKIQNEKLEKQKQALREERNHLEDMVDSLVELTTPNRKQVQANTPSPDPSSLFTFGGMLGSGGDGHGDGDGIGYGRGDGPGNAAGSGNKSRKLIKVPDFNDIEVHKSGFIRLKIWIDRFGHVTKVLPNGDNLDPAIKDELLELIIYKVKREMRYSESRDGATVVQTFTVRLRP